MKLPRLVCSSLITLLTSLCPTAPAQTFSVIHDFNQPQAANPGSGVTIRGGALFGTTFGGGNGGTVYELTPLGSNWGLTVLYPFGGQDDGYGPLSRVLFGPDGHPYGTTPAGGNQDQGTVFELTPLLNTCRTVNCFWKETVLYQFQGLPDGALPDGDLAWDQQGNIYGVTKYGGTSNAGTVYELSYVGNSWTETPIYSFSELTGGAKPVNGVILDNNGNLYGTTSEGGQFGYGTVFELTYTPESGWTETDLYNFENGYDGISPTSVILDSAGNLYGATRDGGGLGGGTVFELIPMGNTWTFKLLYTFASRPYYPNCGPARPLTMDAAGNLYGTTFCDGDNNLGNVFMLTNTPVGWIYSSLHEFVGSDGQNPQSHVTFDSNGNLYGTTWEGGQYGYGNIWMIMP
jgi:hypothetical protein